MTKTGIKILIIYLIATIAISTISVVTADKTIIPNTSVD